MFNVAITCLYEILVNYYMECSFTVYTNGERLNIKIDFGDGDERILQTSTNQLFTLTQVKDYSSPSKYMIQAQLTDYSLTYKFNINGLFLQI